MNFVGRGGRDGGEGAAFQNGLMNCLCDGAGRSVDQSIKQ